MNAGRDETRRVLIAVGANGARVPALEMCRYLLGDAPGELLGLFVEDPQLLAHARSRLAREVVMSGLERELDRAGLERQLRAQSAAARRLFEAAAARLGLPHAFEVARGEPVAELTHAAERADAVVVDAGADAALGLATPETLRRLALLPLEMLLFARDEPRAGGDVVFVATRAEDFATGPGTPLDAALAIAKRLGSALRVLWLGDAAAPNAPLPAGAAEAGRAAGIEPYAVVALRAPGPPPAAAALATQARSARLLVLAAHETSSPDLVAALVAATRSSLLLVRPRRPAPAPETAARRG